MGILIVIEAMFFSACVITSHPYLQSFGTSHLPVKWDGQMTVISPLFSHQALQHKLCS